MKMLKRKKDLVTVVIVTKDRKKDLIECVLGYYHSKYKPLEIIIVDNASKEPVSGYLGMKYKSLKILRQEVNVGAAEGRNIGLKASSGKYILFTDDDAYPNKFTVEELVKVFLGNKDAGIVQPLVYDKERKNYLQGAGHDIGIYSGKLRAWGVNEKDDGQYEGLREVPMCGCVWMVKREVFQEIGNYDEDYFIPYEDSDFSIRARKAGYKLFCISSAKTWHQGKKTTFVHPLLEMMGITSKERSFRTARNKIIFMSKHSPFPYKIFYFAILFPILLLTQSVFIILSTRFDVLVNYWKGVVDGAKYLFKCKNKDKKEKTKFPLLINLLIITILTCLAVGKSINFALFGDDWIALHTIIFNYGPGTIYDYRTIQGFIGPYSVPFHLVALISSIWWDNPLPYFMTAFIFRIFAAVGISFLVFRFTKDKVSSLIAGILSGISPVGLETMNWGAWNMATYLALFVFTFSYWLFITSYKNVKRFIFGLLLLTLSIIIFPQRLQVALMFFVAIDLIWLIKNHSVKNLKIWIYRILSLIFITLLLRSGQAFGNTQQLDLFVEQSISKIKVEAPYIIPSIISSFSNTIIPYEFWTNPSVYHTTSALIGPVIGPRKKVIFLLFIAMTFLVSILLKKKRVKFFLLSVFIGSIWTYHLKQVLANPTNPFTAINAIYATLFGGYFLSWVLSSLWLFRKGLSLVYISICISFFILASIPWAWSNFQMLPTYFRYLAVPGIWLPIFFGYIYSKIDEKKKIFGCLLIGVIAIIHLYTSRLYINDLYKFRNSTISEKLWSDLLRQIPDYKPDNKYAVFYFEGDIVLIYNAITFGFPPRMGVLYKIPESEGDKLPVSIEDYDNFTKIVAGGELLKAFGKNPEKITADRIYAFRVSLGGVENIKEEIIGKLQKDGYFYE